MTGKNAGTSSRMRKSFKYTAADVGGIGRVIAVGKDCTVRTYSCVIDNSKGLKVFADTRYFIEVDGKVLWVDTRTLTKLIESYRSGGFDAAVALYRLQDSVDS